MQRKHCQRHEKMRSVPYGNHRKRLSRTECPMVSSVVKW